MNLTSNHIGDNGAESLSLGIAPLKLLEELDLNLESNGIREEGIEYLSNSISFL